MIGTDRAACLPAGDAAEDEIAADPLAG